MDKCIKITESDINRLVKESLNECVREKVSEQLEKECVETLLECTAVAMLESLDGYVNTINNNYTYTLNEAQLNEADQNYILNGVRSIYERAFVNECRKQLNEMMTEEQVNEIAPLIGAGISALGRRLLGGGLKKLAGKALGKLGGSGIKNIVGGLGKNLLHGGAATAAGMAGVSGGRKLMNLLKNKGGDLKDMIMSNPRLLATILGGGAGGGMTNMMGGLGNMLGGMGGMNGLGGLLGGMGGGMAAGFIPMLMNMMQSKGNGGGMANSLMNMFGGSGNSNSGTTGNNQSASTGATAAPQAQATPTADASSAATPQAQTTPTATAGAGAAQEGKKKVGK